MKEIKRKYYPPIKKELISLKNIENYENIDINLITKMLNEVIEDNVFNTFELLELLMNNYQDDFKTTIKQIKDYSNVRFNCYYVTKVLKAKLAEIGLDFKIISYKSIGFSSPYGDSLIKEAHMSLLLPTIKDNELYYLLLDPGLRIPTPLGFFANRDKTLINIDQDEIIIKKNQDKDYSYCMEMKGYNRYSINNNSYYCQEYFDVLYETINPEEVLFPISYEILDGYRIIRFSISKEKWACIKLMIVDSYLDCSDYLNHIKISFEDIIKLTEKELIKLLEPFTIKLNINSKSLVKIIFFIIKHREEFIKNVFNQNVLKEKL